MISGINGIFSPMLVFFGGYQFLLLQYSFNHLFHVYNLMGTKDRLIYPIFVSFQVEAWVEFQLFLLSYFPQFLGIFLTGLSDPNFFLDQGYAPSLLLSRECLSHPFFLEGLWERWMFLRKTLAQSLNGSQAILHYAYFLHSFVKQKKMKLEA